MRLPVLATGAVLAILFSSGVLATPHRAVTVQTADLDLDTAMHKVAADSLTRALAAIEATRPDQAPAAALTAGALHFARGEYRAAIDAYGRAAARLEPARKGEPRYWIGVSWLALGEPNQARAAFEEVARTDSPRRADAMIGVADCWLALRHPERAESWLDQALDAGSGERTPAALERRAALAGHDGHDAEARDALERIARDWPRSIEAASARVALLAGGPPATDGPLTVIIGTFLDPARARSLVNEARRAGFPNAEVVTEGEGLAAIHQVRLGRYSDPRQAERAGEQAGLALGVTWQVTKTR
jgi:tetratricopeptide (TPR) repeat protein